MLLEIKVDRPIFTISLVTRIVIRTPAGSPDNFLTIRYEFRKRSRISLSWNFEREKSAISELDMNPEIATKSVQRKRSRVFTQV